MLTELVVNHRQIAWLVGSQLMTGIMITFLQSIIRVAHMDSWFSQMIPILYAIFVSFVLMQVVRKFPGKSLFEVIFIVCGKWVGGLINLALLFYIWISLTIDMKGVSHFLKEGLLPRTPLGILLIVFVLLIMSYRRLDTVVRVNEMFFPLYCIMCLSTTLLLANEYSLEWFEPIFTSRLFDIFAANYMTTGLYGDVLLIGAFLPSMSNPRLLFVSMKHGIVLAGFVITVVLLVLLGVMGYKIGGSLNYPAWALIQEIHITDYLDRVELLLLSLWFPAFAIKVMIGYLAFMVGLSSFSKNNYYGVYSPALGSFLVGTVLLSFYNARQLQSFFSYGYTTFMWFIHIPVILILLIGAAHREEQKADDTRSLRKRRWMARITYASILGSMVSVVIGKILYEWYLSPGLIISICYLTFFVIAVISSYLEMQIVSHHYHRKEKNVQHTE